MLLDTDSLLDCGVRDEFTLTLTHHLLGGVEVGS